MTPSANWCSGIASIIGVSEEGKAGLVVGVTDDLTGSYNAVELARAGARRLAARAAAGAPISPKREGLMARAPMPPLTPLPR